MAPTTVLRRLSSLPMFALLLAMGSSFYVPSAFSFSITQHSVVTVAPLSSSLVSLSSRTSAGVSRRRISSTLDLITSPSSQAPYYYPRHGNGNGALFSNTDSEGDATIAADDATDTDFPTEPTFDGKTTATLIIGQAALVVVSVIAAALLKTPNYGLGSNFALDLASAQDGLLATLPLFGLAVVLDKFEDRLPALQKVSQATQRSVLYLLGPTLRPLLALVVAVALGLAAGVGEEMLFRGVLQTELAGRCGSTLGAVAVSSVIFGALHAVTPLYALLATVASFFFGWLFVHADLNLAVPIVAHAVYDVGALLWAHYVVTNTLTDDERRSVWRGEDL